MTQDLASMKITQETEDQVMALFAQIEALLPGLVNLPTNDRSNSMGAKSERYVRITMDLANQNAGLIPPDVDLAGANADLEARDRMMRITQRAKQFVKQVRRHDVCARQRPDGLRADLLRGPQSCSAKRLGWTKPSRNWAIAGRGARRNPRSRQRAMMQRLVIRRTRVACASDYVAHLMTGTIAMRG